MPTRVRVFLDVNMMKYAVDEVPPRWVSGDEQLHWGDSEQVIKVHRPVVLKPRDLLDAKLAAETALLPLIALLARLDRLELLWQVEAEIERWGLMNIQDRRGHFYGAPITWVPGPFPYSRIVVGTYPGSHPKIRTTSKKELSQAKQLQVAFIASLTDPRLLELRRACKADKGQRGIDANQLIDAFHLWTAERSGATHFLTAEHALLKLAKERVLAHKVHPVEPSQLVAEILPSSVSRLYYRARLAIDRWYRPDRWHIAAQDESGNGARRAARIDPVITMRSQ